MSRNNIQGTNFAFNKTIDNKTIEDIIEDYEHEDVTGEKILIDSNDSEAFLVRKEGDTGDVFLIDNASGDVISYEDFQLRKDNTSADLVALARPGNQPSLLFRSDLADNGTIDQEYKVYIDADTTSDFFIQDSTAVHTFFTYDVSEGDVIWSPVGKTIHSAPVQLPDGTTANPSLSFSSDPAAGFKYLFSTISRWAFCAGAAEIFDINSSGVDIRDTKNICFATGEYCIGRNNVAIGSITNTVLSGDVLQIEIPNGATTGFQIHNSNNAALFEMDGTASGTTHFKQNVQVPLNSTIYNSGNDGLKVNDTGSYTSLVTSGFENIRANSVENFYKSALHTFTPTSVLDTTVDYKFQVGDGAASFTDLVSIDEGGSTFNNTIIATSNILMSTTGSIGNGSSESLDFTSTSMTMNVGGSPKLDLDANRCDVSNVRLKVETVSAEPLFAAETGDVVFYDGGPYLIVYDGTSWRMMDGNIETFA